jgi:hypothetical protein
MPSLALLLILFLKFFVLTRFHYLLKACQDTTPLTKIIVFSSYACWFIGVPYMGYSLVYKESADSLLRKRLIIVCAVLELTASLTLNWFINPDYMTNFVFCVNQTLIHVIFLSVACAIAQHKGLVYFKVLVLLKMATGCLALWMTV